MTRVLLVVNMRGTINIPTPVEQTLAQLNLEKRYRATIITDDPVYMGMLRKAKDHIAWYQVDTQLIQNLLEKRGRRVGGKPLTEKDVNELGYKNFSHLAEAIAKGDIPFTKIKGMKQSFALAPPRHGFKRSTRRMYSQGGILGENPELQSIVELML